MNGAIPPLPNTPSWRDVQNIGTALPLPLPRPTWKSWGHMRRETSSAFQFNVMNFNMAMYLSKYVCENKKWDHGDHWKYFSLISAINDVIELAVWNLFVYDIVNCIQLAQDRDMWWALLTTVVNIRVPWKAGNFLIGWTTVGYWRRNLRHGFSWLVGWLVS
jgi:hypothetical protein